MFYNLIDLKLKNYKKKINKNDKFVLFKYDSYFYFF